jgi:long-subunit acyl-CoA synthetase (AMP-forming)
LPLQHVFERVFIYVVLFCGGHVRFYSGAITELAKDLAIIKPTVIPIVPRLLNMFYSMLKSFGHVDKELAEKAWKVKVANWEAGIPTS